MGQEVKVLLDLKAPVLDFEEEPLKDKPKDGQSQEEAPVLTRGKLLSAMLMNGIKTDDSGQRAKLNRYAKKVTKALKGDGKMEMDEERLKEIKDLVDKVHPQTMYATPQYQGDIWNMLEDAQEEILSKKRSKPEQ